MSLLTGANGKPKRWQAVAQNIFQERDGQEAAGPADVPVGHHVGVEHHVHLVDRAADGEQVCTAINTIVSRGTAAGEG